MVELPEDLSREDGSHLPGLVGGDPTLGLLGPGGIDRGIRVLQVRQQRRDQGRGPKLSAYARAKVPVYWIINLVDRQVEVYTRPLKTGRYRTRTDYEPGQSIPVVIDGQERLPIAVDAILP